MIQVEWRIHSERAAGGRQRIAAGERKPAEMLGRVPRISRMMALANRMDQLPQNGTDSEVLRSSPALGVICTEADDRPS